MFSMRYATRYPKNHSTLEREMTKILRDPRRKENVKKIQKYLSRFIDRQSAPGSSARRAAIEKGA